MSKDDVIEQVFQSLLGFMIGGAILMMTLPINYRFMYRTQNAIVFWVSIVILIGTFCWYTYLVYDAYRDYKKSEEKKCLNLKKEPLNILKKK